MAKRALILHTKGFLLYRHGMPLCQISLPLTTLNTGIQEKTSRNIGIRDIQPRIEMKTAFYNDIYKANIFEMKRGKLNT